MERWIPYNSRVFLGGIGFLLAATTVEQYVTLEIPPELISNWQREGGGNKTNDFRAAAADVIQVRVAATVFKFEHGDCTTRSRQREKDGELAFNLKAEIVHNMQNVCVSSIERFQARLVVLMMQ
ncbi:hypothetical protein WN944_001292 [Citrus x changshan-huyou]|uniref:Uncharacterized protein n=1 Tax=Citrus x changshan-huyou TaxID=2935761 RepID=A0AAP0QR24_9ROSI